MLLVQIVHGGRRRRDYVVNEEEQRVFWPQVNALSDQEIELANGQIGWYQILFLIQIADSGPRRFLDDDL